MALVSGAMGDEMLMLNRTKRVTLAAVIGFSLCITSANAVAQELILRCGASERYIYNLEGRVIEGDNSGYHEWRSYPPREMFLKLLYDGSYDILYSDEEIGTHSLQQEGADIDALFVSEDTIFLIARYPLVSINTYLFSLKNKEVIWTTVTRHEASEWKFLELKYVMRAPCD